LNSGGWGIHSDVFAERKKALNLVLKPQQSSTGQVSNVLQQFGSMLISSLNMTLLFLPQEGTPRINNQCPGLEQKTP
jgi:hypothetical protein